MVVLTYLFCKGHVLNIQKIMLCYGPYGGHFSEMTKCPHPLYLQVETIHYSLSFKF